MVAPGSYPAQRLSAYASKTSGPDVVFRPTRPGTVSVAGLDVFASHVEIRDTSFTAWPYWRTMTSANHVTFRRDRSPKFTIAGSSNVSIIGGVYGPFDNGSNDIAPASPSDPTVPRNILIDGATIHGFHQTDGASHVDCLHSWGLNGLIVRRTVFFDCEHFAILLTQDSVVGTPTNVIIENNFLDCCRTGYFSIYLGDQHGEVYSNYLIRNNSTDKAIGIGPDNRTVANVRFYGNVAPSFQGCARPGVSADYNVWYEGSRCGRHDSVGAPRFRAVAKHDFHLLAGSVALEHGDPTSYPRIDLDGQRRPHGRLPDAGADERD